MPTEINRVTRCVIEGRKVIAVQHDLIETLKLERLPTEAAEKTLAQLQYSHAMFEDRLQRLTSEASATPIGLSALLRALLSTLSLGHRRSPSAAVLAG
jgi:hypothetical protein